MMVCAFKAAILMCILNCVCLQHVKLPHQRTWAALAPKTPGRRFRSPMLITPKAEVAAGQCGGKKWGPDIYVVVVADRVICIGVIGASRVIHIHVDSI